MVNYLITYIAAWSAGRTARGPDWHGSTQEKFSDLFDTYNQFTMSYKTYMSVAEVYRNELDALPHVMVTGTPPADPCADVSCPDKCVGVDKFNQVCQDGICVRGTLLETNSVHCGYTPDPTPDPTPTPTSDTYIVIIALMLAGTYMILRR